MQRNFKNIKAWQYADDLVASIYSKTKSFPREELYGVTFQLRKAVVSVPTNIAEGASREHKKEYLNFLYIARGSLAETEYLLHLANRLKYLQDDDYQKLENIRKETAKTLHGLINSVRKEIP
jgi:four helix bundle protein